MSAAGRRRSGRGPVATAVIAACAALLALAAGPAAARAASAVIYPGTGHIFVASDQEAGGTAPCPAGTYAIGGGFEVSGHAWGVVFPFAAWPSGTAGWSVSGSNADNLHDYDEFEGVGACIQSAALWGYQQVRAEKKLNARFDPTGHDEGTAFAACPAGTRVVGGGFQAPQFPGSVEMVGTQPQPESNGWSALGYNGSNLESGYIEASAVCIASQFAQGLLEVHYVGETASIEEGSVETSCIYGGQGLAGGATASGHTGSFEALSFTPDRYGFRAEYNSGKPGHNTVEVAMVCGDVGKFLGELSAADFNHFCEDETNLAEGARAVPGKQANEWECVWTAFEEGKKVERTFAIGGAVGEVCRDAFYRNKPGNPKAIYTNLGNPLSWRCFEPEEASLEASPEPGSEGLAAPPSAPGVLVLRGSVRLPRGVDLARAKVGLRSLLLERSARGELVRGAGGDRFAPLVLSQRGGSRRAARRVFGGGKDPHVRLVLDKRPHRLMRFALRISGGKLRRALLCPRGNRGRTELTTRFSILRGEKRLADVSLSAPRHCAKLARLSKRGQGPGGSPGALRR